MSDPTARQIADKANTEIALIERGYYGDPPRLLREYALHLTREELTAVATLTAELDLSRREQEGDEDMQRLDREARDAALLRAETAEADLAQARQDAQVLRDYIAARTKPRQGTEPQYDQSDADAFYLADENHKLRQLLVEALQARDATLAEGQRWKNAIIDAAVVHWTYQKAHEDDPRAAIHALLVQAELMALDPTISQDAAKLQTEAARTALLEAAEEFDNTMHEQWTRDEVAAWLRSRAGEAAGHTCLDGKVKPFKRETCANCGGQP